MNVKNGDVLIMKTKNNIVNIKQSTRLLNQDDLTKTVSDLADVVEDKDIKIPELKKQPTVDAKKDFKDIES